MVPLHSAQACGWNPVNCAKEAYHKAKEFVEEEVIDPAARGTIRIINGSTAHIDALLDCADNLSWNQCMEDFGVAAEVWMGDSNILPQIPAREGCHLEVENASYEDPCVVTEGDCSFARLNKKISGDNIFQNNSWCELANGDKKASVLLFAPKNLSNTIDFGEVQDPNTNFIDKDHEGLLQMNLPADRHIIWGGYVTLFWQDDGDTAGCLGQDCDVHANWGCHALMHSMSSSNSYLLDYDSFPCISVGMVERLDRVMQGFPQEDNWAPELVSGTIASSAIFTASNWNRHKEVSIISPDMTATAPGKEPYRAELVLDSGDANTAAIDICGDTGSKISWRYLRLIVKRGFIHFCGDLTVEMEGVEIYADPLSPGSVPQLIKVDDNVSFVFLGNDAHRGLTLDFKASAPDQYWLFGPAQTEENISSLLRGGDLLRGDNLSTPRAHTQTYSMPKGLLMKPLPDGKRIFKFEGGSELECKREGVPNGNCILPNDAMYTAGNLFAFEPHTDPQGKVFYRYLSLADMQGVNSTDAHFISTPKGRKFYYSADANAIVQPILVPVVLGIATLEPPAELIYTLVEGPDTNPAPVTPPPSNDCPAGQHRNRYLGCQADETPTPLPPDTGDDDSDTPPDIVTPPPPPAPTKKAVSGEGCSLGGTSSQLTSGPLLFLILILGFRVCLSFRGPKGLRHPDDQRDCFATLAMTPVVILLLASNVHAASDACRLEVENGESETPCVAFLNNDDCSLSSLAASIANGDSECRVSQGNDSAEIILFKPENFSNDTSVNALAKSETHSIDAGHIIRHTLPDNLHVIWAGYPTLFWQGDDDTAGCLGDHCNDHSNGGCFGEQITPHSRYEMPDAYARADHMCAGICRQDYSQCDGCRKSWVSSGNTSCDIFFLDTCYTKDTLDIDTPASECFGSLFPQYAEAHRTDVKWNEGLITGDIQNTTVFSKENWETKKKTTFLNPNTLHTDVPYHAELVLDSGDPALPAIDICGGAESLLSWRHLHITLKRGFIRFCGNLTVVMEGVEIKADPISPGAVPQIFKLDDAAVIASRGDDIYKGLTLSTNPVNPIESYFLFGKETTYQNVTFLISTGGLTRDTQNDDLILKPLPLGKRVFQFEESNDIECKSDGFETGFCVLPDTSLYSALYIFVMDPVTDANGKQYYRMIKKEQLLGQPDDPIPLSDGQQMYLIKDRGSRYQMVVPPQPNLNITILPMARNQLLNLHAIRVSRLLINPAPPPSPCAEGQHGNRYGVCVPDEIPSDDLPTDDDTSGDDAGTGTEDANPPPPPPAPAKSAVSGEGCSLSGAAEQPTSGPILFLILIFYFHQIKTARRSHAARFGAILCFKNFFHLFR
ncbi:MAG: hypothetical protein Q7T03_00445 [Deltaproteobacteria bacterium]|nr:hypothetical protein [Deltaproteobacteria bacterium]